MSAVEESKTIATLAAVKDYMLLRRVSWSTYQALLEAWGPRAPRHTYDRGSLEIMAKSSLHEILKSILGTLLRALCEELRRPYVGGGETTLQKEDIDRGIEPDNCFWLANAQRVVGKLQIDFDRDPPPDLFLEVEVSRTVLNRLDVLAALGVPEVWRFDGQKLQAGVLQENGTYSWSDHSPTFPELSLDELVRFVEQVKTSDHMTITLAFRAWAQQHFKKP